MKSFIKKYGKTILFFAITALIGGFFTGLFMIDTLPEQFKQDFLASMSGQDLPPIPVNLLIAIVTSIQSTIYAVILGTLGIVLGKKVGLICPRKLDKKLLGAHQTSNQSFLFYLKTL